MEAKGLDIVRRDWCPLSKDAGGHALTQILSGEPGGAGSGGGCEVVVAVTLLSGAAPTPNLK